MATQNKLPKMYDTNLLIQAGINPKNGLPYKWSLDDPTQLKLNLKKNLRVKDEQQAINRFTWYNLPAGLTQDIMERVLYYRGQGMFFKLEDQFYFLPYTLAGTIDVYGRYTDITPLPFNGSTSTKDKEKEKPWITGLTREVLYNVQLGELFFKEDGTFDEEKAYKVVEESCIIIRDYSEQLSQTTVSRQLLQEPLIDVMSEQIPYMRTALINSTGVDGMRVGSQDEQWSVEAASQSVNQAALTGRKWIPVIGPVDFQNLTSGNTASAEEFLLAYQALDNMRLQAYGLNEGGVLQKKAHMLQSEQNMNSANDGLVFFDSLRCRQEACSIINSIWGFNMWVLPNEMLAGVDINGDGMLFDQAQPATQSTETNNSQKEENNNDGTV